MPIKTNSFCHFYFFVMFYKITFIYGSGEVIVVMINISTVMPIFLGRQE